MSRSRRLALLALVALFASFVILRLEVGTDITHFRPDRHPSKLEKLSIRLADSPFSRTMVLSVEAEDTQASVRIARQLAAGLRENPEVAWLRAGVEEDQLRELYGLYFPRRFGFLSEAPERELPNFFSDEALRGRARQLKLRLASPAATFFEESAVADPIGAFERVIQRFQRSETQLASRGGQFVTRDERFAIILLGLRNSAFASGPQARLLRDIDAAFEQARAGSDARLEMSGANRFSGGGTVGDRFAARAARHVAAGRSGAQDPRTQGQDRAVSNCAGTGKAPVATASRRQFGSAGCRGG